MTEGGDKMKIKRVVSGVVILENEDMQAILDAVDSIHRYSVFDVVRGLLCGMLVVKS